MKTSVQTKQLSVVLLTALLFKACTKSETQKQEDPAPVPLIKTVTITQSDGTISTHTYMYENGKRKATVYAGGGHDTLRYTADSAIFYNFDGNNHFGGVNNYFLNSDGFAQSYSAVNANGTTLVSQALAYNNDDLLTRNTASTVPLNETRYYYNYTGNWLDSIHTRFPGIALLFMRSRIIKPYTIYYKYPEVTAKEPFCRGGDKTGCIPNCCK